MKFNVNSTTDTHTQQRGMPGNSSNDCLKEFFDELREAETHNPNIDE